MPIHDSGGSCSSSSDPFSRVRDQIQSQAICPVFRDQLRIRRHMHFEALGTLNLISDSMDACEQIMLGGEVHFLLCHYHAETPTRFEPGQKPRHGSERNYLWRPTLPSRCLSAMCPMPTNSSRVL